MIEMIFSVPRCKVICSMCKNFVLVLQPFSLSPSSCIYIIHILFPDPNKRSARPCPNPSNPTLETKPSQDHGPVLPGGRSRCREGRRRLNNGEEIIAERNKTLARGHWMLKMVFHAHDGQHFYISIDVR